MLQEQYLHAERLREAVYVDKTNGIDNQRSFDVHMQQLLAPDADLACGGLVFVSVGDLDEVKRNFGYEVGDGLLRAVARAVDGVIDAENSICARLGGALFGILLSGITRADGDETLQRLVDELRAIDVDAASLSAVSADLPTTMQAKSA